VLPGPKYLDVDHLPSGNRHLSPELLGYFWASIFSITRAVDPPRSNVFPLAVTFCPANGRSLSFWPLDGVVSAIGQ